MKRISRIAVAAFGLLSLPTSSMADIAIMGVGATSCGELAADHKQNPKVVENALMIWAQGFISGANTTTKDEFRDMAAISVERQKQILMAYCDTHPLAQFIEATMSLYFMLPLKKTPPSSAQ